MKWQQVLIDSFGRVAKGLEEALAGLSQSDLDEQPHADCNSMGWLTWHLTRGQDTAISWLTGQKQVWMEDGWHAKFNRAPNPGDTGFGAKSDDVAAFKSPEVGVLLGYHRAVFERSKQYLGNLSTTELGRNLNNPAFPTVEALLIAILSDDLQHLGQVAYLRGLLKGKGWMSR
jgi:DinB superfamily